MAPIVSKNKIRSRDGARSGSRHTTPGSTISASIASPTPTNTAFLDIPITNLVVPTNIKYDDILERYGGNGGIPDPKHLETIANDLKTLAALAKTRSEYNDGGMRELSNRRKEAVEEEREREQQAAREREKRERENAKKDVVMEDVTPEKKNGKSKRKERSTVREEKPQDRPLNHGAHGLARQDGLDLPVAASPSRASRASKEASSPPKGDAASGDSSSLSEASPVPSPSTAAHPPALVAPRASSSDSSSSSDDNRQPPQSASIPQYQTFGTNPLTFDDPTIYEVRKVTPDMTDEERKVIYGVSSFPKDDLADLIAGTPPNKDFSNAVKPNNQVQAHTFASYLEGYLRPYNESDIAFLKERGDNVTPFIIPQRGKRHYSEIWAEEDGVAVDSPQQNDRLNPNQPRGAIDQMDDGMAETDQISGGPMLNRLLATMRYEHRASAEDKAQSNGAQNDSVGAGDSGSGPSHEPHSEESTKAAPIPSATAIPDATRPPNSAMTHAQIDDRVKQELRHIGFIGQDQEPDYDGHFDDEVAERLRILQARLKDVMITNRARKARLLPIIEEQMAYQEYTTILEDLDNQVVQAYLKRARTAGKSKKNVKRPGGPGGGSHYVGGSGAAGVSKPGVGDAVKQLIQRRARWIEQIGPIFEGVKRYRTGDDSIFTDDVMEPLVKAERERWEEEEGGL